MGALLGDDDIVVRTTSNGIVIESNRHEVRDDDEQHASQEVIQVLQTAHLMSSISTSNIHAQYVKIGVQLYMKGIKRVAQQTVAMRRNGPGGFIGGGIAPVRRCMSTP